MGNPVVHFEIGCRDSKKTPEFYSGLFDWKFESTGSGGDGQHGRSREWPHQRARPTSRITTLFFTFVWTTFRRIWTKLRLWAQRL
jgi:hypothetical protein